MDGTAIEKVLAQGVTECMLSKPCYEELSVFVGLYLKMIQCMVFYAVQSSKVLYV